MEEGLIRMSWLNDYLFCPMSIYWHGFYEGLDRMVYQSEDQILGTQAHRTIDERRYSTSKDVWQGRYVYSGKLGLVGKIDVYNRRSGVLTERKRKVSKVYDGYVFQLYAQFYALEEMGCEVRALRLHSLADNRNHPIPLPRDAPFHRLIGELRSFDPGKTRPAGPTKCARCIYSPLCEWSQDA